MDNLEWGAPVDGWRLSLSLDRAMFLTEERVVATIVLQNVADKTQGFGGHGAEFDYTLDCKTEHGEPVALTAYGKLMRANRDLVKTTGGVLQKQQVVVELSVSHPLLPLAEIRRNLNSPPEAAVPGAERRGCLGDQPRDGRCRLRRCKRRWRFPRRGGGPVCAKLASVGRELSRSRP